ncbi:MAG: NAD(P)/FAD-dependent oxidoreductase [Acidobacteriaceae bacterium]
MGKRDHDLRHKKACVIGAGPNGLSAAIVLAQAGLRVDVFEAEAQPGGGARTMELTLPGFHHDFGSAVHPMAAGSPFFNSLPLADNGLEWIDSPAPLAHPFDDGSAITLERNLQDAERVLQEDGPAWGNLMAPLVKNWPAFAKDVLRPLLRFPSHPFLLANFAQDALAPATFVARRRFRNERTRALFAGLAAHSFLRLNEPLSASFGMVLGAAAHAVGWPIPRGGAQAITDALSAHLVRLGGKIIPSTRVEDLDQVRKYDIVLCDITPRQLLHLSQGKLSPGYRKRMEEFRYGPGIFKVDYALSSPIPWKSADCLRAATVHLGGSMAEIVASEAAAASGAIAERPFILLAQPTLFDPSRAPAGKHIAWAYCHIPNGSSCNMLPRIEAQIERFAPGFGDCVLARRASSPADLQSMDANLIGGDISGGASDLRQFLFRPTWRQYATCDKRIYLCSSSTPPGGGVHGMCGYNAAKLALRQLTNH